MDNKELIEKMQIPVISVLRRLSSRDRTPVEMCEDITKACAEIATAHYKSEWVSVETPPKDDTTVLIEAHYKNGLFHINGEVLFRNHNITMYLPNPPKDSNNG